MNLKQSIPLKSAPPGAYGKWHALWWPTAVMLCLLVFMPLVDEILDIPHYLLGAPKTPINYQEAIAEMVIIFSVGMIILAQLFMGIKVRKKAQDELLASEELYRSTNAQLRQVENEIRQLNADLEERVMARTRELRETNSKLEASIEHAYLLAREVSSASEIKSQFLANVSHEIRTPLNAIIGYADLSIDEKDLMKLNRNIQKIKHAADQLLQVVSEILDMSEMEYQDWQFKVQPFQLRYAIQQVADRFQKKCGGLEIAIHIDDAVPEHLNGDVLNLQQVFRYLIDNAIKFSNDETSIRIGGCLLEKKQDCIVVKLWVKDNGIGIAKEHHEMIFQPFTQVDGSLKRKYGGVGLGLCICQNIIELMGGKIWVESELGKGSCFFFTVDFMQSTINGGKLTVNGGQS